MFPMVKQETQTRVVMLKIMSCRAIPEHGHQGGMTVSLENSTRIPQDDCVEETVCRYS
jgi:anti-sigma factor ChrR (cupin superfamily)